MAHFDRWWVEEVGHPPSSIGEREAFRRAHAAWLAARQRPWWGHMLIALPWGILAFLVGSWLVR